MTPTHTTPPYAASLLLVVLAVVFGAAGILFTIRWYLLNQSALVRLFAPGLIVTAELCAGVGYLLCGVFTWCVYVAHRGVAR